MATRPRTAVASIFDLPLSPLVPLTIRNSKDGPPGALTVYILGSEAAAPELFQHLSDLGIPAWQHELLAQNSREHQLLSGTKGPIWVVRPKSAKDSQAEAGADFASSFSTFRDLAGALWGAWDAYTPEAVHFSLCGCPPAVQEGVIVGLELGAYRYLSLRQPSKKPMVRPTYTVSGVSAARLEDAQQRALASNIARHLVNLPPAELNPASYAAALVDMLATQPSTKVTIWDPERCKAEGMGLLSATGGGAEHGAHLVHIRYRPPGSKGVKPVAFVGKGVCFDSGGLDIKPSSAMRLMKKDMGGSAALAGLAWWLGASGLSVPVDLYLALAENAVSAQAFRPSDVLRSRLGLSVEIHNTDAEGRLVMADAMTLALEAKGTDSPSCLIDVATLTGAIKVGLGSEIAGLFANDDSLAAALCQAGATCGEGIWRMPLFRAYEAQLKSGFADLSNCSSSGFGGAITAALFLRRFAGKTPWAHLDIYAWTDGPSGCLREAGGNGQSVQTLVDFLRGRAKA